MTMTMPIWETICQSKGKYFSWPTSVQNLKSLA